MDINVRLIGPDLTSLSGDQIAQGQSAFELLWIRQGSGQILVDGKCICIEDNLALWFPADSIKKFSFIEGTEGYFLTARLGSGDLLQGALII